MRDRLARVRETCRRVSGNFEVDGVLRDLAENAREMTGTRYGVITTHENSGGIEGCVTSGLTPEQRRTLLDTPGCRAICRYLQSLRGPLEVRNLADELSAQGIRAAVPGDFGPLSAVLAAPMRYDGVQVGNFLLAGKEAGRDFTGEDEEVLEVFASQAATIIANDRSQRGEQRAKADAATLADTSPVCVVVLDAKAGSVVSINREMLRIAGELGLPGRSVEDLRDAVTVHQADGREIPVEGPDLRRELGAMTTVRAEEVVIRGRDGRSVTMLVNATPIRSPDDEAQSVVVTLQDMTPLKELERMRAEFLAMVSRELRAPLLSVKGCSATVLEAPAAQDRAEMLEFFRIIDGQVDRMRDLIGDLLDASQLEAGTLSVRREASAVEVLVDQARNSFLGGGGRNPLEVSLPTDLPRVLADGRRIVQVLEKLLSNASRHSPEWASIRIAGVRDGMQVAISVTDEGAGVSAEMLPHLFRKLIRAEGEGRTPRMRGPHLDLAICKGLVEAHGGRIWAESGGPGQGARLTFTLPVAEEVAGQAAPEWVPGPHRAGRTAREGRRVLVVDDDPHTVRYIRHILKDAGYSVAVTVDPDEVPRLLEAERPELVLLDLLLPGKDGIELMQDTPALRELPVILVSAYGREETVAKALEMGAADYVVKPFSPTELVTRIQSALLGFAGHVAAFARGDLVIHYQERRVTLAGRPLELTQTEFDLLRQLAVNAGRVLTYETLLRRVWGQSESRNFRLVRAFMRKLRQKLGDDAASPTYIFTVHRVGYRMAKADPE